MILYEAVYGVWHQTLRRMMTVRGDLKQLRLQKSSFNLHRFQLSQCLWFIYTMLESRDAIMRITSLYRCKELHKKWSTDKEFAQSGQAYGTRENSPVTEIYRTMCKRL